MLWAYDNAIVEDLRTSFNTEANAEPVVCVVPPENIISIAAQLQDDKIHFPMIAVSRQDNIPIDNSLVNFTRMHEGVPTVFDKEKNELYFERAVPVKLEYTLVCISTNTADIDEIIRELIFKYTMQYFLTIDTPYESKRKIRFGIRINPEDEIEWYSKTSDYLNEGKLHSASIHLYVDGAVLLTYVPVKLRRLQTELVTDSIKSSKYKV